MRVILFPDGPADRPALPEALMSVLIPRGLNRENAKELLAVYGLCLANLLYMVSSVSIAEMCIFFAPVEKSTVMLTMTLPCLTSLLGVNLIPALQARFSLKRITEGALLLGIAAGALCLLLYRSLAGVLFGCGVMGVAYGVFTTIYPLLAADVCSTKDQRATVMANCTAMVQVGRLLALFIGGLLADIAWHLMYLVYAIYIVSLLLVALFLKDRGPRPKPPKEKSEYVRLLASGSFVYVAVTAALYLVLYYTVSTYASLYIQGYGLGVPSTTGTLSSVASFIAIFTALLSAAVAKRTKGYTSPLSFVLLGISLLLPGMTKSLFAIGLALILASAAKSQQMPTVIRQLSAIPDDRLRASAMALKETFVNIGYFLSPTITAFLGRALGDGSPSAVYFGSGACALAIGVLMIAIEYLREKKGTESLTIR